MSALKRKKVVEFDTFPFDYGHCTHIGQRPQNQDEVLVPSTPEATNGIGYLFAVADGMGGHPGGAFASRMACDRLKYFMDIKMRQKERQKPVDISRYLVEAVIRADRAIRLQGLSDYKLTDMGTTLSCLIITGTHSVIAHVGDSRIYRLRKGRLSCLTTDHTFVQDMIFEGEVDPAQAHLHPFRHMLTRAVGTAEPLECVDLRIDPIKTGDVYLLCTDGLYGVLDDDELNESISRKQPAADMAGNLVEKALQQGASDNVTVVIVKTEL